MFENGTYEANGSHPTPGRNRVSFTGLAQSAGYRSCHVFDDLAAFTARIGSILQEPGPTFVTTKKSGMGLGLSICREIVEAHGGHLTGEPAQTGGTVFRFTLPVVEEETPRGE